MAGTMPASPIKTLVTVATYNEIENLPKLVDEIFQHVPQAELLVIDDNSPDGTGKWADQRSQEDSRVRALHRFGKLGLGTAIIAGMQYAIEHDYHYVLNLDADFSHPPRYLPALIDAMQEADVAIGSRYVPGGATPDWPWHRRLMSRAVNAYARWLLGLPVRDCSGALRCYRVALLRKLDFTQIRSRGYSFQEEILWRLKRAGAKFTEVPIVFQDRRHGRSKIHLGEGLEALWVILRLAMTSDHLTLTTDH